jgi:hypothetical protein
MFRAEMGFSFHATGRLKRTEECLSQSRTIDDPVAAPPRQRPKKTRRHELSS